MLDIMYDDIMFFKECGVRGLFIEQESTALGMQHIMAQLAYEINWNPDMTRDEYSDALDAVLRRGYGDGWAYIREYIDGIWQKSQDIAGHCWNCWGFGSIDMRFFFAGKDCAVPAGVAHYLEHKMFDLPEGNAMEQYAEYGGGNNAFTNYTMTAYYVECTDCFEENPPGLPCRSRLVSHLL